MLIRNALNDIGNTFTADEIKDIMFGDFMNKNKDYTIIKDKTNDII
jgi:hypothetical protein